MFFQCFDIIHVLIHTGADYARYRLANFSFKFFFQFLQCSKQWEKLIKKTGQQTEDEQEVKKKCFSLNLNLIAGNGAAILKSLCFGESIIACPGLEVENTSVCVTLDFTEFDIVPQQVSQSCDQRHCLPQLL